MSRYNPSSDTREQIDLNETSFRIFVWKQRLQLCKYVFSHAAVSEEIKSTLKPTLSLITKFTLSIRLMKKKKKKKKRRSVLFVRLS